MADNSTTPFTSFDDDDLFGRYEFLQKNPHIAIPCIIMVSIASLAGTFGNILILTAVATHKKVRNIESVFIVNLAMSDLYVTAIADPLSIVAKLEGEKFFNSVPGLCKTIGSLCTISCIGSLMSIGSLSFNRYIRICHQNLYSKLFTKRSCICLCVGFYIFGVFLVLLNLAKIGDHQFDRKAILCIWDRMATHNFTIVFSVVLVWIPMILIGVFYSLIYFYVARHKSNTMLSTNNNSLQKSVKVQVAKTFFIIYAIFSVCWIPYALAIAADHNNSFSHEAHTYIAMWAHLHPSINWIVYYTTHRNFRKAFNDILCRCRNPKWKRGEPGTASNSESNNATAGTSSQPETSHINE
ncbi:hypothetical protein CHS0354_029875 [Potamilus streckersoni]|uniref:G-protein coupled receptors family 1 profile domain-containing protein n=1 Tax=Potamilus streckersoni TaxID=2493646 RepID=A0AAE0TH81_9BIVA|nr:hypothetical protein CHS0354_029875 [Potamilus streckersoni]